MKKENLKTFIYKTNSGDKLENLNHIQTDKITRAEFVKNEIKDNKANQYIYFALFVIAFILVCLIFF